MSPRVYVRVESAQRSGEPPTPADEAAALRVANRIAAALGLDAPAEQQRQAKPAQLRGVALRLDVEG